MKNSFVVGENEKVAQVRTWFIIYVRSRAEKKIALSLEKSTIPYFLPMHRELRQWTDRKKWIEIAMFPSYIFVHINKNEYPEVLSIPGVLHYVSIQGKAVQLDEQRMADIRRAIESNKVVEVLSGAPAPGDLITITNGALKGLKGTVIHYEGKHHLLVAIEELGKYLKIKIQPEEL